MVSLPHSGINSKQTNPSKDSGGDWAASFGKGQPLPGISLGGAKAGSKVTGGYVSSFMGSAKKQASKYQSSFHNAVAAVMSVFGCQNLGSNKLCHHLQLL